MADDETPGPPRREQADRRTPRRSSRRCARRGRRSRTTSGATRTRRDLAASFGDKPARVVRGAPDAGAGRRPHARQARHGQVELRPGSRTARGHIQLFLQANLLGERYDGVQGLGRRRRGRRRGRADAHPHRRAVGARRRAAGCSSSRCGRCPTSGTGSPTPRRATGMRYVDLIVNPESRAGVRARARGSCATCATSSTPAASWRSRRR